MTDIFHYYLASPASGWQVCPQIHFLLNMSPQPEALESILDQLEHVIESRQEYLTQFEGGTEKYSAEAVKLAGEQRRRLCMSRRIFREALVNLTSEMELSVSLINKITATLATQARTAIEEQEVADKKILCLGSDTIRYLKSLEAVRQTTRTAISTVSGDGGNSQQVNTVNSQTGELGSSPGTKEQEVVSVVDPNLCVFKNTSSSSSGTSSGDLICTYVPPPNAKIGPESPLPSIADPELPGRLIAITKWVVNDLH